jgi:hypothetical protein
LKISAFSIPDIPLGKHNIKDNRLDQVEAISKSKKKTYIQVELVAEDACFDADAILTLKDMRTDLILKDLDFVETRLARAEQAEEKIILDKLKSILEKEDFIFQAGLTEEQQRLISGYSLITNKPVTLTTKEELGDLDILLTRAVKESGFISFFTTGERETRAWLIKQGTTAWEAAGCVHSDIQKGFIRAEVISAQDFIQAGGENPAKQLGKLRLEQKDYLMQDGDLVNFRFNK